MQRRACIASRMQYSSVVSPRQTLARDQPELNPAHQLVIQRMRLPPRVRVTMRRGFALQCFSLLMLSVTLSLISLMPLVYISTELLKYATPVVSETIADNYVHRYFKAWLHAKMFSQ